MKKLFNLQLFLFVLLLVLPLAAKADTTWTGGGDGISWNSGANWTGDPMSQTGSTIQITADATNTQGGNGIVSMNQNYFDGQTLRRNVNLNAGTLRIDQRFETGNNTTFTIGDGNVANGTATVDLNGRFWMPNRHEGNRTYQIVVQSDGSLVDIAGGGEIRAFVEGDRNYIITVAGGLVDVEEIETGKIDPDTTYESRTITINSGTVRVDRITRRSQGNLGTAVGVLNLNGGVFEIEGTANAEDFSLGTINFRGGTFRLKSGSAVDFVTSEDVNLDDDGGDDVTFDTSNGNITWNGIFSGTGGLAATGGGTFTLSAANTYTGNTTINGAVVLDITGTLYNNGGTPVNATFSVLNTTLTDYDFGAPLGDLQTGAAGMLLTNTTLRSTASNTLARSFSLGVGGGTLESVTAGQIWTIQGPDAIDVGNESLTLTGAGNIVVDTGITGAGGVIKTGTGTATLFTASTYNGDTDVNAGILDVTGAHSGNGDFNANGGTLNLNDRAYEGVATGNFNLADGATLNFANTFRCGDGVAGTYTFNLGNGTVSGLENNATFFAGAAHTVNLLGAYQHTLQSTTVFTGQNIDYQGDPTLTVVGSNGGVDLASLNVPAGKKLSIQIANTNTQGNAALTATGNITIAQGDLTIDLDTLGYTVAPGRFDVFEGNWTNASPSWEILKDGYTISYVYANNVLFGTVNPIFEPSQEVTNPEAVMVISTGSPTPNSPTSDIKVAMQGATTTERDRIVQQFTPSMAAAGVIQNYNADRALLRLVGIELDNP